MAIARNTFIRRALTGILPLFAALHTVGCVSPDYIEMYDLPTAGWDSDKAIVFTFQPDAKSSPTDSGQWIDLTIRHREDFAYDALRLEIKSVAPDKSYWIDTIAFPLSHSPDERTAGSLWAGRHYSNHYDLTRRYRSGITYPQSGEYALSIRQLGTPGTLQGILSVGITASSSQAPPTR